MKRYSLNPFHSVIRSFLTFLVLFTSSFAEELSFAQVSGALPGGGAREYTYNDTRYGNGGKRVENIDGQGRVRKRVWKDNTGRVLEEETTIYGMGEQKTVDTFIYNPTPDGGRQLGTLKTTKTDSKGKEIFIEVKIFDKNNNRVGGNRTEVGSNGEKRTFSWDPKKKDYVEDNPSGTSRTVAAVNSSASRGFAVASDVVSGLNTTTFDTPRGKIYVNLTDDLSAGDTLSGTVVAEAEGQDEKTRTQNQAELSGYVVEIEKQQSSSTDRILKLDIPAAISTTYLILKDKKGKEVARSEVPVVRQPPPAVERFDLPTIGQQGRPVEVTGAFDGDFGTTNLKVGGEEMEILAESPRKLVARNTSNKTGLTQLVLQEQGRTSTGEFRSLGIRLSAPKLDLLKGEQTTLTVTVLGLEGIKAPVPLVLENKSPGVINMGSANLERISINPSQVQGGTYTTERPLTGIQRGAFTIVGTVVSDGQ